MAAKMSSKDAERLKKQMGISDRIPAAERPATTCGSIVFADKRHPKRNSRRARQDLRKKMDEQLS